jgi:hypothetical protein
MSAETSYLLNKVAVGIGITTMLWAMIVSGITRKRLARKEPQPSAWSESFVQATARYLTKKQKVAFFVSMSGAIALACFAAILRR